MSEYYKIIRNVFEHLQSGYTPNNSNKINAYTFYTILQTELTKLKKVPNRLENKIRNIKKKTNIDYSKFNVFIEFNNNTGIININNQEYNKYYKIIKNFDNNEIYYDKFDKTLKNIVDKLYYEIYIIFDNMEEYYNMMIKYNNSIIAKQTFNDEYYDLTFSINQYVEIIPKINIKKKFENIGNFDNVNKIINENIFKIIQSLSINTKDLNNLFTFIVQNYYNNEYNLQKNNKIKN